MLRQRLDTEQGLITPGPFPVHQDLVLPEPGPLPNELQGSGFEAASKHFPVRRNRGSSACMVSREVGHRVITLVPVHVDHHTVERADTRHESNNSRATGTVLRLSDPGSHDRPPKLALDCGCPHPILGSDDYSWWRKLDHTVESLANATVPLDRPGRRVGDGRIHSPEQTEIRPMRSVGVPIPTLEPPWPDRLKIAVISSVDAPPGWRRFAHEVAAAAQPGGHSFPLPKRSSDRDGAEHGRTAFLYSHANQVCGYLCLANKLTTGYRSSSAGYRHTTDAERVTRPCVTIAWVAAPLRRHGVARQLI